MCFEMQGLQAISHEVDIVSSVDEVAKGPMILCIDTSGSMSGTPEFIAKAVSFIFCTASNERKTGMLFNKLFDFHSNTGTDETRWIKYLN